MNMKRVAVLTAVLACVVGCGQGVEPMPSEAEPQVGVEQAALSYSDPIVGEWASNGYKVRIYTDGWGIITGTYNSCWPVGAAVWSGICDCVAGAYQASRHTRCPSSMIAGAQLKVRYTNGVKYLDESTPTGFYNTWTWVGP